MDEKQAIIAEMLELQHLFEKQTDEISKEIVSRIKQAVDKLASKRLQGANIPPQAIALGYFIRDEVRDHDYQLTSEQRNVLLDVEDKARDIENKFQPGIALF
ncbi:MULTISPECIES: hypothetical protein [Lacticaseibacillus]|uniref:hypothetical protein n=1 Tax=Lacticaseibacillus TaxID=2759736 RepID=UPI00063D8CC1|nr:MULTISPECIES: hypothetical protein [Lacticaseibacillus]KLI75026.1 hypothetical protein AAW28_10305 [Lacticaseibacillus casei]